MNVEPIPVPPGELFFAPAGMSLDEVTKRMASLGTAAKEAAAKAAALAEDEIKPGARGIGGKEDRRLRRIFERKAAAANRRKALSEINAQEGIV